MKDVALVFYGQPRAIDNDFLRNQWKNMLDITNLDVDVYGHFWSTTSNTNISKTYENFVKEQTVDVKNIKNSLLECLPFKKLVIEDSSIIDEICNRNFSHNRFIKRRVDLNNPSTGRATLGQWYSTQKGVQLANANGEYKIIVRVRWDLIFNAERWVKVIDNITRDFLEDEYGIKMQHIGTLDVSIVEGQPIVNDWLTIIPRSCFEFFSENLTDDISTMMNSIFSVPEMPLSVQENAFYRFLKMNHIDTKKVHMNCRIHRENDDPTKWRWPNFSI